MPWSKSQSSLPHCKRLPLASAQLRVFVFGSEWVWVGVWSVASAILESNNGAGRLNDAQLKLVTSSHRYASTGEFLQFSEGKCHKQQLRVDGVFQVVRVLILQFLFKKGIIEM